MYTKFDYIKENIELINLRISSNTPLLAIAKELNVKYDTLKKHIRTLGINYKGNQNRKGLPHREAQTDASYYFDNTHNINASYLRAKLIRDGYKQPICECCNLREWMGKPIPLELHHKDGNHYNNNFENLMILCANCHMQIHNYCNVK